MVSLGQLSSYGSGFQIKVLASLLNHKEFLQTVYDTLEDDFFDNPGHKWIVEQTLRYFHKYHTTPTLDALKIEAKKIDNDVLKVSVVEQLREAYKIVYDDREYIEAEFSAFCRNQQLKKALLTSVDLLNDGKFDDIRSTIDFALRLGQEKSVGHEYLKDIETRYRGEYRTPVPTAWNVVNKFTGGGLGAGDLGIIFGNPGGGKCVDYNTKIEIEYPEYGIELKNKFDETYTLWISPWDQFNVDESQQYGWKIFKILEQGVPLKIQKGTVQEKVKIGDLFSKLGIESRENNNYFVDFDLKIQTPYGFKKIVNLFTTEKQSTVTTLLSDDRSITTSKHHLFRKLDDEWTEAKDLNPGSEIQTVSGKATVVKQEYQQEEQVLYDMGVEEVQCYYGNGILSHNSWSLVSIGAAAMEAGKTVIHYTLELSQEYVGKRYDAYFTKTPVNLLDTDLEMYREQVEKTLASVPGQLIIQEYPMRKTPMSSIEKHLRKCIGLGYTPDIVIIDYVDLIRATSSRKFADRKEEIDDVYMAAKALAKEFKVPVWTVSQVNRSGSKDDVIEGDKAAGSYDKIMVADFILSLSRKRLDKTNNTGRFHFMKNRYGRDGMTFPATVDTSTGDIVIEEIELDEDSIAVSAPGFQSGSTPTLFSKQERDFLSKKFFELQGAST
jgi:replicative DNA helicase